MTDTHAFHYLDMYCERAGEATALAEPLNAFTNLAFIIAAYLVAHTLLVMRKSEHKRIWDVWVLVGTLGLIGFGSGAWHMFATHATLLMDVIPIGIFIHVYVWSFSMRILRFRWWEALMLWGAFQGGSMWLEANTSPDALNGTMMYVPTYLVLLFVAAVSFAKSNPAFGTLVKVIAVWTISLTFRTMDMGWCSAFPFGTHFLWHLMNAWVLYQLLMILTHKVMMR